MEAVPYLFIDTTIPMVEFITPSAGTVISIIIIIFLLFLSAMISGSDKVSMDDLNDALDPTTGVVTEDRKIKKVKFTIDKPVNNSK